MHGIAGSVRSVHYHPGDRALHMTANSASISFFVIFNETAICVRTTTGMHNAEDVSNVGLRLLMLHHSSSRLWLIIGDPAGFSLYAITP